MKLESPNDGYEARMPKTKESLWEKLNRSNEDIKAGRFHSHEEVEIFFAKKFETNANANRIN